MPDYLANHKASKIKVGDWVTVFRRAYDAENGWNNGWVSDMDLAIGETGQVVSDKNKFGFGIKFPTVDSASYLSYPYFVLRIVR